MVPPSSPPPHADDEPLDPHHRAVAPLISVVLMVAITVILAALLGTFMIDLGEHTPRDAPTTSLGITDAANTYDPAANDQALFVIEHQAGDDLDLATTRITIRHEDATKPVLTWKGWTGVEEAHTTGTTAEWTIEHNTNDITTGVTQPLIPGDTIVITVDAAAIGGATELPDRDRYRIIVSDADTDSPIAVTTIELR